MYKIDKIDRKIALELIQNSRRPVSQIASVVNESREKTDYRIDRLINSGIIVGLHAEIHPKSLGVKHFVVYANCTDVKKSMKKFIAMQEFGWVGQTHGKYRLTMDYYPQETQVPLSPLKVNTTDFILLEVQHYLMMQEKLLNEKYEPRPQKIVELSSTDKSIAMQLQKNSRASLKDLAKASNCSTATAKKHLLKLRRKNIISRHSATINHQKLGWRWHGHQIRTSTDFPHTTFQQWCVKHPNVLFYYQYLPNSSHTYDIGIISQEDAELISTLDEIQQFSKQIIDSNSFYVLSTESPHAPS